MNAGKLRRKLQIETSTQTQGSGGGVVNTWVLLGTFFGSAEELSGDEREAAMQIHKDISMRFTVRRSNLTKTVDAKDRIIFDGFYWDIKNRINDDSNLRFMSFLTSRAGAST